MLLKKIIGEFLRTTIIVCLAYVLSYLIAYDISSISYFNGATGNANSRISDFYFAVANQRSVATLDKNVVIVSIDGCSREQIAEVIEMVDFCAPMAVGLDVMFNYPSADDNRLVEAICSCDNLILPVYLHYDPVQQRFDRIEGSFFYESIPHKNFGAVNLAGNNIQSVIREFRPEFPMLTDTIPGFALALARKAAPQAYQLIRARARTFEIIDYPSREYEVVKSFEVLERKDDLTRRVVLIGAVDDPADKHITPVDYQMPGVRVLACSLSTILDSNYIRRTSTAVEWAIAIFLCSLVVVLNNLLRAKKIGNLAIRVFQFLLLYCIMLCGCKLFIVAHLCMDFTKPLLMVGLGLAANDIWYGSGEYLISWFKNKRKNRL